MLKRTFLWDAFGNLPWLLFVLAAVVAAGVLIVMLLRYERRLVSRKVGISLLLLRVAVLLTLFLTLMEPVVRWTFDRDNSGTIVVAVDLSESMSTADVHATKAEKLRWARALGMIGNEKTNSRIDRWIAAYKQGQEPAWVDDDETDDPKQRQALARNRRETVQGVLKEVDRLSRKDIALRLLTKGTSPLLKRLREVGNVHVVVFAGKAEEADEQTLPQTVRTPPERLLSNISDLRTALATPRGDDDGRIMGMVLLTDGRDNAGRELVSAAKRLGRMEAPVYPVVFGSVDKPTDISIGDLTYPETAFKDDKPQLKARINTPGFEGKRLTVHLDRDGKEPLKKTITPDGPETTVVFDLDSKQEGRHEYNIRLDVQPQEARDDNNRKSFAMTIVDDTVQVLLVEGEARWEFRFIDNAFERDERVESESVVFRQPYLGILERNFFPRKLQLPADPDDLENSSFAEPDLVIVGDVSAAELTEQGWQLLERFVGEAGGTLVMVAGKEHLPRAHHSPTMESLLPVTDLRPLSITGSQAEAAPDERGFHLRLTPEGKAEPMFRFDDDLAENDRIWSALPGHTWGLLGEAKKGTTVYAYAQQRDKEQTLQQQRRSAVIVHRHYGFGQVLWIGIDSTWRWRHRVGDKYHHRFWGQIGRWAADNKSSAGNDNVRFGPERTDLQEGEDVLLRARWSKRVFVQFPNLKAQAVIYRADDKSRTTPVETVDLNPDTSRPLLYTGRALSLEPGEYKVRLKVLPPHRNTINNGEPIEAELVIHSRLSTELQDLSANQPLLAQLADVSAGKLLRPDEAHQLPQMFRDPKARHAYGDEFTLWDHWLLLVVFFALLMSEWVVRKLNGLP